MAPRKVSTGWCCQRRRCARLSSMTEGTPEIQFEATMDRNFVEARINNQTVNFLVDSGASISCISQHQLQRLKSKAKIQNSSIFSGVGVCGEVHPILGEVVLNISFGNSTIQQKFYIFETLHAKAILGLDFLRENNVKTNFENMTLTIPIQKRNKMKGDSRKNASFVTVATFKDDSALIALAETIDSVILEPHSETAIPVYVPKFPRNSTVMLEPNRKLQQNFSVAGARNVTNLDARNRGIFRLLNPTNLPVYLDSKLQIAVAQPVQEIHYLKEKNSASLCSILDNNKNNGTRDQNILADLGINIDDADITAAQKWKLSNFIGKNRDIFAKDLSELGKSEMHYHTIYTKDNKMVSLAPYRQSPQMRGELDKQMNELIEHGIIEPSTSPFHSPVVLVKKKNGEYRFCVDFRKLNSITEPMSTTIPHMSDIMDTLAEEKPEIYSTLDLRSGFWQVPLDPATKHKSAFITHRGVYEFNRLPFGMMNSPMTFQCLMTKVLKNLNFKIAMVYIDDVVIFSKNFEEHLYHLDLVFSNLREANLKLHPSKCKFAKEEVKYLGHIISKHGIKVDPGNTSKVKEFKIPKTAKQVKSFLGMASYYRKFVKDYAHLASPLTALLKKNNTFKWTMECQSAFDKMKAALVSAPILAFPQFNKPFILSTDASEYSTGYVLSQMQNGLEHPIAYGGRALRGSELKWHINEKETLALVEGIQLYKHYLANHEFTVYTDNVSVKYLQNIKDCQGRLGRWSLLLQGYNFKIVHREGSKNTADCLSRQQYPDSELSYSTDLAENLYNVDEKEYTETVFFYKGENPEHVTESIQAISVNEPNLNNLAKHQKECRDFSELYQYKLNRQLPVDPDLARTIVAEAYNFELEDGILKHFYSKRSKNIPKNERLVKQIAVPRILRDDLLRSYHDCILGGGHQGFDRTYASLRNKYFWPSMYEDIKLYVQSCEVCQQSKRNYGGKRPPLKPQLSDDIFSKWHMDILSGLPTTPDKNKHVLLVVDSYSKWCEAFPLKTQEAGEVAAVLYKEIISRYGAPRVLISDRGRNFTSNLVKALSEMFQITRHLTSSYHPQTNGSVERMNSVILQAIRSYAKDQQDDWVNILPGIMMAYRATPATQSTDYSPFFLLYGREMSLPVDTSLIPKEHLAQNHKIFLSRILQNLEQTRKIASENMELAQQRNKLRYDRTAKEPEFRPTQRVWLYCTKVPIGKAPKLHRRWVGPYYITLVNRHNHTYKIRNMATNKEVKSLVTAHRLKPYYDPKDRPTNPPPEHEEDEIELDPDEIQDQINIDNTANNNQQHNLQPTRPDNNNRNQRQIENNPNRNEHGNDINRQQQQRRNDNRVEKNQQNNNKHGCADCTEGTCRPFRENIIDRIISSSRQQEKQYYRVKFISGNSDWFFKCKIPEKIIREFHANRTADGKKRKRPLGLSKHKFFDSATTNNSENQNQNSNSNSINVLNSKRDINPGLKCFREEEKLMAVRRVNNRPYFLIQTGQINQKWHTMASSRHHAGEFIGYYKNKLKKRYIEEKIQRIREKETGQVPDFILGGTGYLVHEAVRDSNGEFKFLLSWQNDNMPPEWVDFEVVPNGCISNFLEGLECIYDEEINPDW